MRASVAALGLALASGCRFGTRPDTFPPALRPEGASVAVRVRGERSDRKGELLAVDSAGVTIRTPRIVRVAWTRVSAMDVDGLGSDYDVLFGESISRDKIARLALVSRFPQGISQLPITLDSVIARAGTATVKYANRWSAVSDGYIRVGADFPSMGEHWLNRSALLSRTVNPEKPTLLIYANIAGAPKLLGVGFVLVTRGDSTPVEAPGWPDEWHEHSGLLSDESGAVMQARQKTSDTHVWVLHAWTALQNPDGPFAADNWALPYARAGLAAPRPVNADAARALALAYGGDAYVGGLLTDAGVRTERNAAAVDAAIAVARERVAAKRAGSSSVDREDWRSFVESIEKIAGPEARALLVPSHTAHPP